MDTAPRLEQLIADGLAASREGRADAALALFSEAQALAPSSGIPAFLIASEQAGLGRMDAAEAGFANALLLAPGFTLARYQLGLLQFSSGRAAVALLTWQPLFDLPATDPLHHFVRGFAALGQDRLHEALQHFRAGLDRPNDNPALAADVMKIVTGIERQVAPQPPDAAQQETPVNHVLLAGYSASLH